MLRRSTKQKVHPNINLQQMTLSKRHVHFRTNTAAESYFPMWVMRVSDLMEMKSGEQRHHQRLKAEGKLIVWDAKTMGACAFISHQWSSWKHADPTFEQLDLIKSLVERIVNGDVTEVRGSWLTDLIYPGLPAIGREQLRAWAEKGYIWFDWFSIPQLIDYDNYTSEPPLSLSSKEPSLGESKGVHLISEGVGVASAVSASSSGLPKEEQNHHKVGQAACGAATTTTTTTTTEAYPLMTRDEALDLQCKAINSIPAYVERCELFIVPCPPITHGDLVDEETKEHVINDYASWSRRGWCRCEMTARVLSRASGPIIILKSPLSKPVFIPPHEVWSMRCGHGEYACCQRDHRITVKDKETGEEKEIAIECDKLRVGKILDKLIMANIRFHDDVVKHLAVAQGYHHHHNHHHQNLNLPIDRKGEDRGKTTAKCDHSTQQEVLLRSLVMYRWLLAMRGFLLDGLSVKTSRRVPASLSDFLTLYHFQGIHDESGGQGWTPLRYAILHGYGAAQPLVRELLDHGCDIERPLGVARHEHSHTKGFSILMTAACFASSDMLTLLLQRGANPLGREASGVTPLHCAVTCRRVSITKKLLEFCLEEEKLDRRLVLDSVSDTRSTPLHAAVIYGSHVCAMELLKHGANTALTNITDGNLLYLAASCETSTPATLRYMLQNKVTPYAVDHPTRYRHYGFTYRNFLRFRAILRGFQGKTSLLRALWGTWHPQDGRTPLHIAAYSGNLSLVKVLLEHGARVDVVDSQGRTPLDESGYFPQVKEVLLAKLSISSTSSSPFSSSTFHHS